MKALGWSSSARERVLSIVLVIAILGALGMLGYVIATPKEEEWFTEFYILGLSGRAADYPKEIRLGEAGAVIVGIVNHEHKVVNYRVEIKINGVKNNEVGPVVLANEQKWQEVVTFTPTTAGDNQKMEFLLYENEGTEPRLKTLYLRIDVTE